jgi:hypothetical protein
VEEEDGLEITNAGADYGFKSYEGAVDEKPCGDLGWATTEFVLEVVWSYVGAFAVIGVVCGECGEGEGK